MKTLQAILGICILLFYSSCKKDNDTSTPPAPPLEEVYDNIINPQEERYDLFTDLTATMDTVSAIDSVLTVFLEDPNVEWAIAGSQGIAVQYKSGICGGIFIDPLDDPEMTDIVIEKSANESSNTVNIKNIVKTIPGSKKAIFLNPSYWERAGYADQIISNYGQCLPKIGFEPLVVYKNEEANLEKFKHLSEYGIIHIYSHGMAWPSKYNITTVYLLTGQEFSDAFYGEYKTDLMEKDIINVTYHGITYVLIKPEFIIENNNFKDSDQLFYGGFCFSGLGDWPDIMNSTAHVSGYFGFDWSVYTSMNTHWNRELVKTLTNTNAAIANSTVDWMNNDLLKYYYNVKDDRFVNITYKGLTDLVLFDEDSIVSNFSKCTISFRVHGYYDYYSNLEGNETSYSDWDWLKLDEYQFEGSLSGNTFTGSNYWHDDAIGTYDYNITVTFNNSRDQILNLVYSQRKSDNEHTHYDIDFAAENIPLSTNGTNNNTYMVEGTETCNYVTSVEHYVENDVPLIPLYSTITLVNYECDEYSYAIVEFE